MDASNEMHDACITRMLQKHALDNPHLYKRQQPEPDEIDMRDAFELRDELRKTVAQVTRLRELCREGLRIIKDLGNNNIFSHKAVADLEQRLRDEGVVK